MRDFKDFENLDARSLYTSVQYNIYLQNLKHLIKFCRSFRRDPLHAPSGDREYTALDGPSAAGLHDAAERRGADGALVLELRDLHGPELERLAAAIDTAKFDALLSVLYAPAGALREHVDKGLDVAGDSDVESSMSH